MAKRELITCIVSVVNGDPIETSTAGLHREVFSLRVPIDSVVPVLDLDCLVSDSRVLSVEHHLRDYEDIPAFNYFMEHCYPGYQKTLDSQMEMSV